ncbi:transporter family protein [Nafulsella turpanensis]|uniref:transporter n=1 Tax=Nafulsella turpanensis TaxID=1265690 RepID=UPI00034835C3|nr:transporter [Nafulsella turpanensis]
MKNLIATIVCFLLLLPAISMAQQEVCLHSDAGSITPAGVMGSHTHHKGSWMFSYQFMQMHMQGNLSGADVIESGYILDHYMMAPQSMDMQMHMLGAMNAISDKLTLMGMLPYLRNQMQMVDRMGMTSAMHSSQLGDISLSALYSLRKTHQSSLQLNVGLGFPTGSIDESASIQHGHMHHEMEMCLPYLMQTGSGTLSLLPALTYMGVKKTFSYGLQASGKLPLGDNKRDYRPGTQLTLNSWAGFQQNKWLGYSLRLEAMEGLKLRGQNAELDPMMSPAADAMNSGGRKLSTYLGAALKIPKGSLKGNRLALEYGIPLYQQVNGIQMQDRGSLIASWQYSF